MTAEPVTFFDGKRWRMIVRRDANNVFHLKLPVSTSATPDEVREAARTLLAATTERGLQ